MAGPECAFTHLHDERKLFPRAVELSTQRFFNGVRVNRYVFPDAAVLHHQVHASARYLPRGHPKHGARTVEARPALREPIRGKPILNLEVLLSLYSEARQVEIAILGALDVNIGHTKNREHPAAWKRHIGSRKKVASNPMMRWAAIHADEYCRNHRKWRAREPRRPAGPHASALGSRGSLDARTSTRFIFDARHPAAHANDVLRIT